MRTARRSETVTRWQHSCRSPSTSNPRPRRSKGRSPRGRIPPADSTAGSSSPQQSNNSASRADRRHPIPRHKASGATPLCQRNVNEEIPRNPITGPSATHRSPPSPRPQRTPHAVDRSHRIPTDSCLVVQPNTASAATHRRMVQRRLEHRGRRGPGRHSRPDSRRVVGTGQRTAARRRHLPMDREIEPSSNRRTGRTALGWSTGPLPGRPTLRHLLVRPLGSNPDVGRTHPSTPRRSRS